MEPTAGQTAYRSTMQRAHAIAEGDLEHAITEFCLAWVTAVGREFPKVYDGKVLFPVYARTILIYYGPAIAVANPALYGRVAGDLVGAIGKVSATSGVLTGILGTLDRQ